MPFEPRARISSLGRLKHLISLALSGNAELVERQAFCKAISGIISSIPLTMICPESNLITDDEVKEIFPDKLPKNMWVSLQGNCLSQAGCAYLREKYSSAGIEWNVDFNPKPDSERKQDTELEQFSKMLSQPLPLTRKISNVQLKAPNEKYFHAFSILFKIIECQSRRKLPFSRLLSSFRLHPSAIEKFECRLYEKDPDLLAHIDQNTTIYLITMRKNGYWGGDLEIAALGRVLNCPIAVFSKEYNYEVKNGKLYPIFNIYNFDGNEDIYLNPKTIYLYRSNARHYLRLIPRQ